MSVLDKLVSPGGLAHSAASARLVVARIKGKELTLRQRLFLFLYEPGHSTSAYMSHVRGHLPFSR